MYHIPNQRIYSCVYINKYKSYQYPSGPWAIKLKNLTLDLNLKLHINLYK